jgi:replicative DNA helicase
LSDLQAAFFSKYPDADKDLYLGLFKTLSETILDKDVGVGILRDIKRRREALKASEMAFKYSTGHERLENVLSAFSKLEEEVETTTDQFEFVSDDLEQLVEDVYQGKGLRWRLDCLNKSLGPLRKGNFGFLFARPETGKTTLLASEGSFMLPQFGPDDGPLIWFNNEQVGAEVMLTFYRAYFGVPLEKLLADLRFYKERFNAEVQGRFKLVDSANIDRLQVERTLKQFQPSLVIFDQIDKIKGFAADREDLRLGSIYIWARELAKEFAPVIGVCQADGTAEGQKWLTMDNVANAKTSKQAEADWILGLGKTHNDGEEYTRFLNISKNKLLGSDETIPHLRHGKFEVLIEPEIARYKDIMRF